MNRPRNRSRTSLAPREQLLAGLPVAERRIDLAGISTAILEGGNGPPVVLLHGPLGSALHWVGVIPALVGRHRVIAPDLPGHGATQSDASLDLNTVLAWLRELIEATCATPPALVGHLVGGAIAARLVADEPARASQLILVHAFGLAAAELAPDFANAVSTFLAAPTPGSHEKVWQHCAFDLDRLQERMGSERWNAFAASNIDGARAPAMGATFASLMEHFGSAIPPAILARIAVPTTLIWGRHDRTMPVAIAKAASKRHGWPLHVIDDANDDPPVEQPEALAQVLLEVLGTAGLPQAKSAAT